LEEHTLKLAKKKKEKSTMNGGETAVHQSEGPWLNFSILEDDDEEDEAGLQQHHGNSYGASHQVDDDFIPDEQQDNRDEEDLVDCVDEEESTSENFPAGSYVMVQGGFSFDSVYRARVVSHICAGIVEIQWLDRGDRAKVSTNKIVEKLEHWEPQTKRQRRKTQRLIDSQENKVKKKYVPRSSRSKVVKKRSIPRIRIKMPEEPLPKIIRRWHFREPITITSIIRNIDFVSHDHCEEQGDSLSDAASETSLYTQETNISQKFKDYEHLLSVET
jgi:hypothetical protein